MATQAYHCTNFANCDKALTKELIEIDGGEEFSCATAGPDCVKKYLQPANGVAEKPKWLPIAAAVAGVLVIGALAYLFWPSGPQPQVAESMIGDYFPRLK